MPRQTQEPSAVSPELDEMVCDLIGYMLDELAAGNDPGVAVCIEDARGARHEAVFTDDGEEACLEAAQSLVGASARGLADQGLGPAERYAIGYTGGVELDNGFADALLVSFYERGLRADDASPTGYSAYVLYEGFGAGDAFAYSDPLPAGEEPPLI